MYIFQFNFSMYIFRPQLKNCTLKGVMLNVSRQTHMLPSVICDQMFKEMKKPTKSSIVHRIIIKA